MTPATKKESFFPSLLSDFFDNDKFFGNRWFENEFRQSMPAVNVIENGKEFQIEFAAPGFDKGDFNIDIEGNLLTVSAEKEREEKTADENERFTRREFSYNSFSRSFTLPQNVNAENINARYADGILRLAIPKKETSKSNPKREIRIA